MRCKLLTQDGYTNRLFLVKRIRKVAIQYAKDIYDLSLFSFISFQNNLAILASKTKSNNADHSSIRQFYQHGLFFPQHFHNVNATLQLISTTFETKSYSRCWLSFSSVSIVFKTIGMIFWVFSRTEASARWARSASHSFCHLRGKISSKI